MTDSIWSRAPIEVPIGSGLGDWEMQDENWLALAEAGLYQAKAPDGDMSIWQRGFDKSNPVDIEGIVKAWLTGPDSCTCPSPCLYHPAYSVSRFVGMGLASMTSYKWRTWVNLRRKVEPVPFVGTSKRLPLYPAESEVDYSRDFVPLRLRARDTEEVSYPYSKLSLDPALILPRLEDECLDE